MSNEDLRSRGLHTSPIVAGAIAGLIAGVPTGIVLHLGTDVMSLLGSIAGGSVVVGWLVHLFLSALFGAQFGWIVEWPVFRTLTNTTGGSVFIGAIHGVVWYAYLVIGVVIPGIVRLLGYDPINVIMSMVPGTDAFSLLSAGAFSFAYLFWGVILGFTYAWVEAEGAEPDPRGPDGDRAPADSD